MFSPLLTLVALFGNVIKNSFKMSFKNTALEMFACNSARTCLDIFYQINAVSLSPQNGFQLKKFPQFCNYCKADFSGLWGDLWNTVKLWLRRSLAEMLLLREILILILAFRHWSRLMTFLPGTHWILSLTICDSQHHGWLLHCFPEFAKKKKKSDPLCTFFR